jgi:hypothetical protein
MNVPDWLWQGLVENAIWAGIAFSAAWAWKSWRAMQRKPVLLSGAIEGRSHLSGELSVGEHTRTVSDNIGVTDNVIATVSKGTPPLARRLEELASWYLHVS